MNKNNKKSDYDFLTESIVNISKAGAYDIVSKQRDELVEDNKQMKALLNEIENELKFHNLERYPEHLHKRAQQFINKL